MTKKIYELTNEELKENYYNPKIQKLMNFTNNTPTCINLLESRNLALKFLNLIEEEIEVSVND